MGIQTGRMANSSYTKLFFPMSEVGAAVDPVDVINGATYPPAQATTGSNGLKNTFGNEATAIAMSAGSFPEISATDSFIIFNVAGAINTTTSQFEYGDVATGASYSFGTSFSSESLVLKFSDGDPLSYVGETITDYTGPLGLALAVDKEALLAKFLVNGELVGTPLDISDKADQHFTPPTDKLKIRSQDSYAMVVFVFPGGLPDDYQEAIADMSARFAIGDMRIWAPWELK